VVSHPSRKNKDAARVGHTIYAGTSGTGFVATVTHRDELGYAAQSTVSVRVTWCWTPFEMAVTGML
jgi:hypothetical protein